MWHAIIFDKYKFDITFNSEKETIDLYESLRLATVIDPSVDADASYASDWLNWTATIGKPAWCVVATRSFFLVASSMKPTAPSLHPKATILES